MDANKHGCRRVVKGLGVVFACRLLFASCSAPVFVACRAAGVGRGRGQSHEEPYSEGREPHPSTTFARTTVRELLAWQLHVTKAQACSMTTGPSKTTSRRDNLSPR